MKKVILVITFLFFTINTATWYTQSEINNIMNNYFESISSKNISYQKNKLNNFLDKIEIIKIKIGNTWKNFKTVNMIENSLSNYLEELNSKNNNSNLILRLENSSEYNNNLISQNSQNIQNTNSVFIFRNKENIDFGILQNTISKINEINDELYIFIDQEWGLINRYKEFSVKEPSDYFNNQNIKYDSLNNSEKGLLQELFSDVYFPSMKEINITYKKISNNNKQNFLDIVAFIKLQNLKEAWINTHWLVLDLDDWNPVITGLDRSFSNDPWEYKKLIDAFNFASKITWVSIYVKHFPGHWAGDVDTHENILVYDNSFENYLEKNMELFKYFFDNWENTWVMIGHMFLTNNIRDEFFDILDKSDYILTDDLAMQGFKNYNNYDYDNMFFSTINILNLDKKIFEVDTSANFTWIN